MAIAWGRGLLPDHRPTWFDFRVLKEIDGR